MPPDGDVFRGQQLITLLLYLDDICIFTANVDEMLDHIEMVFQRLNNFNLKIKPKKCHFFQCSIVFLGYVKSVHGISAYLEKVEKVKHRPIPTSPKELHSFLGLASYLFQILLQLKNVCTSKWVQLTLRKTGNSRQETMK